MFKIWYLNLISKLCPAWPINHKIHLLILYLTFHKSVYGMYNNYVGCEIYLLVWKQKKNFKYFKTNW
jgi:hypothetical protein